MRLLALLLFVIIFTLSLEASYLRTLNIASFTKEHDAKIFAYKLKIKYRKNKQYSDLQYEWDFKFKVLKSGQYHVVKLEPFTQPEVLQEILDILRVDNRGIIVKKLEQSKLEKQNKVEPLEVKKKLLKTQHKKLLTPKEELLESSLLWQILFAITFISFLIALRVIVLYKREIYFNKQIAISTILPETKEPLEFLIEEDLDFDDIDLDFDDEDLLNTIEYSKESIAKSIGLDLETFNELFKEYLRESRNSLYLITEAINVQDYSTSKKEAIKLKGMSDNMRIPSVSCELNSIILSTNRYEINEEVSKIERLLAQLSNL